VQHEWCVTGHNQCGALFLALQRRSQTAVAEVYRRLMHRIVSLFTTVLLAGCLTAGPGSCGTDEAAAFNEIDHFGEQALVPQDHPLGGCGATFSSDADPEVIVEHYRTELEDAGWTVGEAELAPMLAEDGDQIGTGLSLSATKGSIGFSLGAELLEGGEPPTYNIMVGEIGD
jgi:hypothetical protein